MLGVDVEPGSAATLQAGIQILCSRAYRLLSAVASSAPFRCDPTASWLNSSREPQSSQSERPGEPMARAPLFPFAIDHRLPRLPGCRRPEGRLLLPSLPAWAWLRRSLAARPRSFSSRPTAEPLLRSLTHSAAAAAPSSAYSLLRSPTCASCFSYTESLRKPVWLIGF